MAERWDKNRWEFAIFGRTEVVDSHCPIALTIGNFDGVHRGHQHVIQTLKQFSDGLPLVALTFDPHPANVLFPSLTKPAIEPLTERVQMLLRLGLDAVVVQKFTPEFAQLSADEFISEYLLKNLGVSKAVIGFDFCYGTQRQGDWEHFEAAGKKFGFAARRAEPLSVDGAPVSSSRIRAAVQSAEFSLAERLLGRPFALTGRVVKGDQRGREMGFPTANLGFEHDLPLLPPFGVYAANVSIVDGESSHQLPNLLRGVMNCGVRPTIASGLKLQIETHILDFSGDIYGKKIIFQPQKFIRTEMKFSGLEQLKMQIQNDVREARNFFGV
jgi:riboflavin kinase/FMN adenylyltransferase